MKGEVQHLANNERYRILIIKGETYIMDIERPFFKIIFPFFFWLLPNHVFKVEDKTTVERLKTEKMKKAGGSYLIFVTGFSYLGAMLLTPLMDYFNVPMSPLVNIALLVLALILVVLLYFIISHSRKKQLNDVVELEALPDNKIWIRPSSVGHFLNVFLSFLVLLSASVFIFLGYVETRNVMVLIIASLILFVFLLTNRKTVREGNTTVKVKE
ncbi:DUF443 family protein [Lentibacillus daqui]|uniref:DUF443 family protein n=1 Tax=Lentibacillus daqui TaxID=2911514 RepID=UPI0022B21143|nr:DUF443 family protein [Lentibacillus daqui]